MQIIESPLEMQKICSAEKRAGKTIGFIPTMGALHEGHLSLVRAARKNNDIVAVSIYVNPAQFGPNEDLSKYPRTFHEDKKMLESENADYLFFPSDASMYGQGYETYVELKKLPKHLCGLKREGHFRGVTTIVAKLFNIVKPDNSYFGRKDYQQAKIIERMAKDLNIDTVIHIEPIVREADGLAMSSRNRYLSAEERKDALSLIGALNLGRDMIRQGEKKSGNIIREMENFILERVPGAKIDYISIADTESLDDLDLIPDKAVIALAVFIGKTRLIDNILIG